MTIRVIACDNFNLAIVSILPFAGYSDPSYRNIKNFAEHWQRNDLKSQLGCFSYITEKRFKTAFIPFVLLGIDKFVDIEILAPFDTRSNAMAMTPFSELIWFIKPGTNGIGKYNTVTEIDAKRTMPSYIPLLKFNSSLIKLDNSKKAVKQFQEMTNSEKPLALVIIDIDKLLYKAHLRTLKLIQTYNKTSDTRILREIALEYLSLSYDKSDIEDTNSNYTYKFFYWTPFGVSGITFNDILHLI